MPPEPETGYYIVIRGPLGVGKSTVSERLARDIGATHIRIDQILDDRGLWEQGRESEFLRANEFAASEASGPLEQGKPVIFDGNFYWLSVIKDLVQRLRFPHFAFTLEAPLEVCIQRDGGRSPSHGSTAARQVFEKSTAFRFGISIDATRPLDDVVRDIVSRILAKPTRR